MAISGKHERPGVRVILNGEEHLLPAGTTILEFLQRLNVPPVGVAVAVNYEVVQKTSLETTLIHEGDRIEIIRAVQGG